MPRPLNPFSVVARPPWNDNCRMHFKLISTIAVIGSLALSGCADSSNDEADQATSETADSQTQSPAATGDSSEKTETSDEAKKSKLTLKTDSDTVTIEPTDVYCSGEPGTIDHIIGKTNNELPLVKVEKTEFVMVKTGHGRPYKANGPNGIDYKDTSVTFDGTKIGTAVLNGTMTCTKWES